MSDFQQLLNHPKHAEIIDKLVHGVDPRDISNWLRVEYPEKDQNSLRLPIKLLKEFVDSKYMSYPQQFADNLKLVQSGQEDKVSKKLSESLLNNKTFRERLNEHAQIELDPRKIMSEAIIMMRARAEQIFDKIQQNPEAVGRGEYALINWMDKLMMGLEKYDRMVNQTPDLIIQHNVTVQAVDEKLALFQNALLETLAEIDTEASLLFLEKWSEKLSQLQGPAPLPTFSPNQKMKEAKLLQEIASAPPEFIEVVQ